MSEGRSLRGSRDVARFSSVPEHTPLALRGDLRRRIEELETEFATVAAERDEWRKAYEDLVNATQCIGGG